MIDLKAKAYSRRAPSGEAPAGSSSRAAWMTFFFTSFAQLLVRNFTSNVFIPWNINEQ
jgi:hypothetical protein